MWPLRVARESLYRALRRLSLCSLFRAAMGLDAVGLKSDRGVPARSFLH
jgi:hypothetical protein